MQELRAESLEPTAVSWQLTDRKEEKIALRRRERRGSLGGERVGGRRVGSRSFTINHSAGMIRLSIAIYTVNISNDREDGRRRANSVMGLRDIRIIGEES
jgi:hypothetical protein